MGWTQNMAPSKIDSARLRKDIKDILRAGDLSQLSSKRIRKQLEEKYDEDLTERKKEIDDLVMAQISAMENNDKEEEEEDDRGRSNDTNGRSASEDEAESSGSDFDAPE